MGNRLHVAKVYTAEYALPDNFNHEVTEFHDLLTSLDVAYTGESWDDDFEEQYDDIMAQYRKTYKEFGLDEYRECP